eukprot:305216-Pelagomonas_calceolata.AAC.1
MRQQQRTSTQASPTKALHQSRLPSAEIIEPYYERVDLRDNRPAPVDQRGSPGRQSPTLAKVCIKERLQPLPRTEGCHLQTAKSKRAHPNRERVPPAWLTGAFSTEVRPLLEPLDKGAAAERKKEKKN